MNAGTSYLGLTPAWFLACCIGRVQWSQQLSHLLYSAIAGSILSAGVEMAREQLCIVVWLVLVFLLNECVH